MHCRGVKALYLVRCNVQSASTGLVARSDVWAAGISSALIVGRSFDMAISATLSGEAM